MKLFYTAILSILASEALAKDFGIAGYTYEIAEESILKVIEQKLAAIDIEKLNQQMQDKTKAYVERPTAVKGIRKAKEDKTFYYDSTFILDHDIKDHQGRLLYKAGTQVNPLEHVPLREALVFIDGDDQAQVDLALKTRATLDGRAKIALVKGSPLKLQKKHKVWIYFDQGGVITTKLGITEVPAVVEQDGLILKIVIVGENKK